MYASILKLLAAYAPLGGVSVNTVCGLVVSWKKPLLVAVIVYPGVALPASAYVELGPIVTLPMTPNIVDHVLSFAVLNDPNVPVNVAATVIKPPLLKNPRAPAALAKSKVTVL